MNLRPRRQQGGFGGSPPDNPTRAPLPLQSGASGIGWGGPPSSPRPNPHPQCESGGLYWSLSCVWNQASCFVWAHVYFRAGGDGLSQETVYLVLGTLSSCFVIFFSVFLLLGDRRFIWTFFSTERGCDLYKKYVRAAQKEHLQQKRATGGAGGGASKEKEAPLLLLFCGGSGQN